jgi:hypothetical protein
MRSRCSSSTSQKRYACRHCDCDRLFDVDAVGRHSSAPILPRRLPPEVVILTVNPLTRNMKTFIAVAMACAIFAPAANAESGSFTSSDPMLDAIWASGVKTATDMLAPGGQTYDAEGRYCPLPAGETVILDGTERDRCSYIGDESVIDLTFDVSTPHFDIQRNMLELFAAAQYGDGAIPSSPHSGGIVLFDYCGYWATVLYNYVLYSGDISEGHRMWGHLVRLMEDWYPSQIGPYGLLVNSLGHYDYGYIRRTGTTVAYYNAQYVYVLKQAAELASWLGHASYQQRWLARARSVSQAFAAFWDAPIGAYTDTTVDRLTHPEDGNSFAILAGIPTTAQAQSALAYMSATESYSYGNSISDSRLWDDPAWGDQANMRVYPFIGFYDLLARYNTPGASASALNLIRREWGYMLLFGPQPAADWEVIGPYGGRPTDKWPSWDAGWSSGATPALTQYVLGIQPTSPGFATFTVTPHPDGLAFAGGSVVTPKGTITVAWKVAGTKTQISVSSPAGTRWTNPPPGPRRR